MISYTISANGKIVKGSKVSLDIEPQASKELSIPVSGLKAKPGTEYFRKLRSNHYPTGTSYSRRA